MDNHQPLHLAAAVNDISFIHPALDDPQNFFGSPELDQGPSEDTRRNPEEPTQEEIDAVIEQSLLKAEAQSKSEEEHAGAEIGGTQDVQNPDGSTPQLSSHGIHDQNAEFIDQIDQVAGSSSVDHLDAGGPGTSEQNPIHNPSVCPAPFIRPDRHDGITPSPIYYVFADRTTFNAWLEGESSWCHFVQRRSTTPDKRSAERLQTRIAKHNKKLEAMTPEERALALPLKTRRRNRVSPVAEKVTYTCHHAGHYSSQHSVELPKEKLRMNTKKSVKVCYHWKHEGHDPYNETDKDGGRMNKAIDEWMVSQIAAGRTPDEIRRALDIDEEEKKAYLDKVAADPSQLNPNLPPPIALVRASKFKYSEIYNRYRKLKGPIKDSRPHKSDSSRSRGESSRKGKRKASETEGDEMDGDQDSKKKRRGRPRKVTEGQEDGVEGAEQMHVQEQGSVQHHLPDTDIFIDPELQRSMAGPSNTADINVHLVDSSTGHQMEMLPDHQDQSIHTDSFHHQPHGQPPPTSNPDNPLPPQTQSEHEHGTSHTMDLSGLSGLSGSAEEGGDHVDTDFASLAATHESLARALLTLPGGSGLRDEEIAGMSLEEAMRRLAGEVQNAHGDGDLNMAL
ncbi:hypothetical protein LQV05_006332 [Cryptococcus neoformans]|nr:hypothetical protein LQV05_006332 [Cryptococcus neoformans]